MEKIPFYTFGTYYTKGNPDPGPNADEIKNFVYWLKNKWSCASIDFGHPSHPSEYYIPISNSAKAYDCLAEMIEAKLGDILATFNIDPDADLEFVPVPSSDVIASNVQTARWSGREIARRLEQKGLGRVGLLVVNKFAIVSKGGGQTPDCTALAKHFEVISKPDPGSYQIYIDDVLTWGTHVAAVHVALGSPEGACLVAAVRTDKGTEDAYDKRVGHIKITRFSGRIFPDVVAEDED